MVAYVRPQSTDSPTRRHRISNARSSSAVSWWHSSMKFGRLTGTSSLPGSSGRGEVRVVGEGGIAGHPEVGLHPALGREPVVVPPHRVEKLPPSHAPVAGDGVGLDVPEHRAHVERPGHRRRGRVDGEDLGPGGSVVETVGAGILPGGGPALLQIVERRLIGDAGPSGRWGRHDRVTVPGCCSFTTPPRAPSAPWSIAPRERCRCTCVARPSTTCPTSATGGPT